MADMFAILEAKGVASFSALMNTAVNTDFSYFPLVGAQGKTAELLRSRDIYARAHIHLLKIPRPPMS